MSVQQSTQAVVVGGSVAGLAAAAALAPYVACVTVVERAREGDDADAHGHQCVSPAGAT